VRDGNPNLEAAMHHIYYSKTFITGILKGLTVHSTLTYPTVEHCAKAIYIGKQGRDCITGTKWIITDASFQNYSR
jgi:hypothetical protein